MIKVLVSVEGNTEEAFCWNLLSPHLEERGVYLTPVVLKTKRVPTGPDFRGGHVPYGRIRKELQRLLGDTSAASVTTMYDFYALPSDFPGRDDMPCGSGKVKVAHLEQSLENDLNHHRFRPYLQLHEFEALLFADPEATAKYLGAVPDQALELKRIRSSFPSPEEIDDSPHTSPSHRIQGVFESYQKVLDGPLIARQIGLARISKECAHFGEWLDYNTFGNLFQDNEYI